MMRDIRKRKGRIVAVPGPVVIHTGGGDHLGRILRAGYIDAVLAGNALAVHDIERALYGTSLGVHLDTGIPVIEGHKNHMRAINAVRRCGSIARAVEQGVVASGVMYECVRNEVPFVLAGSVRDDGPMPDTLMDLIEAQDAYARLLKGADVVLMLGSMLHSIGVGNMIPAWVKTICVDINPAVVTKLSDRGSAQAIGVVTDVGLFLRLLADELAPGKA
jgi:lysine-ketoglutarate reductase/saccharopine dehydrogenase-like protein (TIGR00300 family)